MKVCIYANCQGIGVSKFLQFLPQRGDELEIKNFENYKLIGGDSREGLKKSAQEADVFIYQPIGIGHGWLSTHGNEETIMSELRPNCLKISFPYLYNDGLWPFYHEGTTRNSEPFTRLFDNGATLQDAKIIYERGDMFFDMINRTKRSLELLREREKETNISISEYIAENYKNNELFLVQNHPSDEIFVSVVRQMANIIFGNGFIERRLDFLRNDNNFAELPGRYPIDQYCVNEGGIKYAQPEPNGYYHYLIDLAHADWLNARSNLKH
ncbi:WcbI family polysaccharide biosynthesis putative acetyltransferase [Methylobacterium aquaticum]|uniref:WcbI family polysaccharide biosynthesis putative acetyltransferase n=1 Tax=Methylobacterium aquaticum TaxID=270351 RepID=UPI0019319E90|nr:WcbI family polysaccharide biosynthesis putative acetyltransferase [Methylobacterium aquaticum]QRE75503.1 hypothetical protein F1D61_19640 [Methylobacterium aquaticum]